MLFVRIRPLDLFPENFPRAVLFSETVLSRGILLSEIFASDFFYSKTLLSFASFCEFSQVNFFDCEILFVKFCLVKFYPHTTSPSSPDLLLPHNWFSLDPSNFLAGLHSFGLPYRRSHHHQNRTIFSPTALIYLHYHPTHYFSPSIMSVIAKYYPSPLPRRNSTLSSFTNLRLLRAP